MSEHEKHVEKLISAAATAARLEDAMKLSQAALNAANALSTLDFIRRGGNVRN